MCSPGATHPVDRKFVNYYAGGSAELMQTTSRVLAESRILSPAAMGFNLTSVSHLPAINLRSGSLPMVHVQ
jgi:hypothetical protein